MHVDEPRRDEMSRKAKGSRRSVVRRWPGIQPDDAAVANTDGAVSNFRSRRIGSQCDGIQQKY